jgi:hypothetical protein
VHAGGIVGNEEMVAATDKAKGALGVGASDSVAAVPSARTAVQCCSALLVPQ